MEPTPFASYTHIPMDTPMDFGYLAPQDPIPRAASSAISPAPPAAPAAPRPITPPPVLRRATSIVLKELRAALDEVVSVYSEAGITMTRFRREARAAWERKHPPRDEPQTYHTFIKEHMSTVRQRWPNAPHGDHMRIIGQMWAEVKPKHNRVTGLKRTADHIDTE